MNASRTYLAVGGEGVRLGDRGRVGGRDAEGGDGCDAKHRARGCGGRTRVGSCLNARTRMRSSCARGGVTISGKSVQHRLNFYQTECAFMTVRDTSVTSRLEKRSTSKTTTYNPPHPFARGHRSICRIHGMSPRSASVCAASAAFVAAEATPPFVFFSDGRPPVARRSASCAASLRSCKRRSSLSA